MELWERSGLEGRREQRGSSNDVSFTDNDKNKIAILNAVFRPLVIDTYYITSCEKKVHLCGFVCVLQTWFVLFSVVELDELLSSSQFSFWGLDLVPPCCKHTVAIHSHLNDKAYLIRFYFTVKPCL